MTQVVYARVPETLKDALDAYALGNGTTLTASVVDLLGRGLEAASDEQSIDELRKQLAAEIDGRRAAEAAVVASRTPLGALEVLRQRSGNTVARCPNPTCGEDVSAFDVLAAGGCTACGQSLGTVAETAANAVSERGADQRELLLLLGAVGALLGAAWLVSRTS